MRGTGCVVGGVGVIGCIVGGGGYGIGLCSHWSWSGVGGWYWLKLGGGIGVGRGYCGWWGNGMAMQGVVHWVLMGPRLMTYCSMESMRGIEM